MASKPRTTHLILKLLTSILLLHLLRSLPNPASAAADSNQTDPSCDGRWIHIRPLPPRFNADLLSNCNAYPLVGDLCPFLANHGLGPLTHPRSRSWFRTDPLLLEPLFHRRLLDYPCLTPDPAAASAVFLPYYAGLDALRFLLGPDVNASASHGLPLLDFILDHSPEIWRRRAGHDHFLVMARPAWDFSQSPDAELPSWGTSFLRLPEFYNVTALTLESRAWPWQEQAIPYPTSFHPSSLALLQSWMRRVRSTRRRTLALFAGGGGVSANPNVRRSIRDECAAASNSTDPTSAAAGDSVVGYQKLCEIVDCSNGACEHDPILYMRPMLAASFCLQPPGDTPTRRSTFDGILAGCIPVFFEDQSARAQYGWHLPESEYGEFSVTIPKEDVVFGEVRIMEVLKGISRAEVRRMREKVIELMPRIIYRRHGSSLGLRSQKDAFDIAIEGTLQRIKSRLEEFPV